MMTKILTALALASLIATPAFAKSKTKVEKGAAPIAADAAAKPAEGGTAPAGEKKEEKAPKKGKGKKAAKGAEPKAEAKPEAKPEAAPAK